MSFYTRKDNRTYREGQMPLHYPADRVYLDGNINKTVQDAIERGSVNVTADGVKTYSQLLTELSSLVDYSKITLDSKLLSGGIIHNRAISYQFSAAYSAGGSSAVEFFNLTTKTAKYIVFYANSNTEVDITNQVPTVGLEIALMY